MRLVKDIPLVHEISLLGLSVALVVHPLPLLLLLLGKELLGFLLSGHHSDTIRNGHVRSVWDRLKQINHFNIITYRLIWFLPPALSHGLPLPMDVDVMHVL